MMRRRGLPLSLLLLLGACAGSPSASPQADQEAKRFGPPPPDKGALYVYRSGLLGMARPIDVILVGGSSAELGYNTFFRVERPPGPVEIGCMVGDTAGTGQVQVDNGQTRFVEVSMTVGWLNPGCQISEVPPDQGQVAVRSARRVEPQ